MPSRTHAVTIATLALGLLYSIPALCDETQKSSVGSQLPARKSIERGLQFLEKDAIKWRRERGCATCHHGAMTVWALAEAKAQGFAVNVQSLADIEQWTKDLFIPRIREPRDPRPGWRLVSVPGIYLGIMSHNLPILARGEIHDIAKHLANHQEEDGAWEMPPPANGAPPIWESRETLAMLGLLAWEPYTPADPKEAGFLQSSRAKTIAWLAKNPPTETAQALTLRLLLEERNGKNPSELHAAAERLFQKQNPDGGWSQTKEIPSDAYATGQALYALSFAGLKNDRPEIQRAVSFLVKTQSDDGSWPMTSRNHPGVESTRKPIRNPVPITYFGSAWAELGLVRLVAPPPDTPAKREFAFNQIQAFHGKYTVDEKSPDRPVIVVDLRYYELSDKEVANFAKALQAFPRLEALQLKSSKMTDAALTHLKELPQLRSLTIENAPITDAALVHLRALPELREVELKRTKVSEGGVEALRNALPSLKIAHQVN